MRQICSANPDWKIRFIFFFFFNNHKYSNGPSEMTMVLGFEIAANFGDCTLPFFPGRFNRQQRLAPFDSMPNLRSQNEVMISELWIETAWCSFHSSSLLLLSHPQLFSPPPPLSSINLLLLHSPPQVFSPLPPLSSSSLLHRSPLPPLLSIPPLLSHFSSSRHRDWVIQCKSAIQTL